MMALLDVATGVSIMIMIMILPIILQYSVMF